MRIKINQHLAFIAASIITCDWNVKHLQAYWVAATAYCTCILSHSFILVSRGNELVATTHSKAELFRRDTAGPEKMPWVQIANTLMQPASTNLIQEQHKQKLEKKNKQALSRPGYQLCTCHKQVFECCGA